MILVVILILTLISVTIIWLIRSYGDERGKKMASDATQQGLWWWTSLTQRARYTEVMQFVLWGVFCTVTT